MNGNNEYSTQTNNEYEKRTLIESRDKGKRREEKMER